MTTTTTATAGLSYLGTLLKQFGLTLRVEPAIARPIVDVARDAKAATTAAVTAPDQAR